MNTSPTSPQKSHSLGYWLTAVDRLMRAEFRSAFAHDGTSRREWRLLSVVDGSTSSHRPLHGPTLRRLADRGWVNLDRDGWTLTDTGRAAKERMDATVEGIRAKATDAVDPDDLAITMATLEKLAIAYGWDAEKPLPRREHRTGPHGRHGGHHRHGHHHDRYDDERNRCDHSPAGLGRHRGMPLKPHRGYGHERG